LPQGVSDRGFFFDYAGAGVVFDQLCRDGALKKVHALPKRMLGFPKRILRAAAIASVRPRRWILLRRAAARRDLGEIITYMGGAWTEPGVMGDG
jgi:hypothetical protein